MVTILCYIKNVARTHISISFITLGGTRKGAPTPSKLRAFAKSRGLSFFAFYVISIFPFPMRYDKIRAANFGSDFIRYGEIQENFERFLEEVFHGGRDEREK